MKTLWAVHYKPLQEVHSIRYSQLKGFKRIFLKAGESAEVEFDISPDMLGWYSVDQYNMSGSSEPLSARFIVENGDFDIMIGPDSRDVQCARLTVQIPLL